MPDSVGVSDALTRLAGAPVSLAFGAFLVVHIAAGLLAVITGAIALLSPKQGGRHPRVGQVYFWALGVVFVTATVMAAARWTQSGYLFFLGSAAFAAGSIGYLARKRRWRGWLGVHIVGMSLSYVVLLTAFYVDNGPKLPLWDRLPTLAFWIGPTAIGLPLILRTLWRRRCVLVASSYMPDSGAAGLATPLTMPSTSGNSSTATPSKAIAVPTTRLICRP
jgi:hypothetical protein